MHIPDTGRGPETIVADYAAQRQKKLLLGFESTCEVSSTLSSWLEEFAQLRDAIYGLEHWLQRNKKIVRLELIIEEKCFKNGSQFTRAQRWQVAK